MAQYCHFKSKATNYYIVSTRMNKDKDDVLTVNGATSVPPDSILTITATSPGIFTITGVGGLYVSLNGDAEGTKLTWSSEKYEWQIKPTVERTNYIVPADGKDLYWFDAPSTIPYVVVKVGRGVVPPDSEWLLAK